EAERKDSDEEMERWEQQQILKAVGAATIGQVKHEYELTTQFFQQVREEKTSVTPTMNAQQRRPGKNIATIRVGEHGMRAAEREGRRGRRRREREGQLQGISHEDGLSTDDEETTSRIVADNEGKAELNAALQVVFVDALDEYSNISKVLDRIIDWLVVDGKSFQDAYVHLCIPKLLSPYIRLQLCQAEILKDPNFRLDDQAWYTDILTAGASSEIDPQHPVVVGLLPAIVEKVVVPYLTELVVDEWDPLSFRQTQNLTTCINTIIREYPTITSKSKMVNRLANAIQKRAKDSVSEDIFIPMYAKHDPSVIIKVKALIAETRNEWMPYMNMNSRKQVALVIERYERIARDEINSLKRLHVQIVEGNNRKENTHALQAQAKRVEDQLLKGLAQVMSTRAELEPESCEEFDLKIEPVRLLIQSEEDEPNIYAEEARLQMEKTMNKNSELKMKAEEARLMAEESVRLEADVQDLNEIFTQLQTIVHQQHDMVDSIEEHVEQAHSQVERGNQQLKQAVKHKNAKVPVVTAVVGGLALGGPVGIAAGSTIAGVAAAVGGAFAAHTIILADPFEDDPRLEIPARSPSPTYDRIFSGGQIAIDEDLHDHEGMTEEELKREMEEREMQAQAQILEIVGDLRSADDVPPENVLFVCKLNPVTTDEDLEIIFARFGKVECCEIIRDRRTGRSLQYAFIEYSDPKFVEAAYLKMDNVLIDDRRIHVDFSQSVSKNYKWHKGQGGRATEMNGQGNENRKPVERRRDDRKPERPVERRQRSRSPRREPRHEERRDRRRVDERDQRRERDRREHRREREREVVVDRWGEVQKREIKREASSSPERSRKDRRQSSPKRARRDASPARKIKKEVVSSDDERDRRDRKDKKKEKKQRRSSSGSRSPSRHRRR
ncbi:unnamed protein product, partial [Mesorhabditis spiculigera]